MYDVSSDFLLNFPLNNVETPSELRKPGRVPLSDVREMSAQKIYDIQGKTMCSWPANHNAPASSRLAAETPGSLTRTSSPTTQDSDPTSKSSGLRPLAGSFLLPELSAIDEEESRSSTGSD
jgi:hypothetical protein